MGELKTCSRCKSEIDISYFGINRKKQPYKTCDNCRKKTTNIQIPVVKTTSFLDEYVKLPIIKLEEKQTEDIKLDAITVLNHKIEFKPKLKRYDENLFTYKEFTQLDPTEYEVGVDPMRDYMPDEYVTPILIKANDKTYRASCLTWFPLTDCSDAIKLKHHETNNQVYPILIKQGADPIITILNTIGLKYRDRLPSTEGYILHQGYTDSDLDKMFKKGDTDEILDFVYERLRELLNNCKKLPSHEKYLATLRYEIWNKFGNKCDSERDYLIMDGLYYDEYNHFKNIVKTFKTTIDREKLRTKLATLGEQLYSCRQHKSLTVAHYSFHAYINILLTERQAEMDKRILNEIHAVSLDLNHAFSGIGTWLA